MSTDLASNSGFYYQKGFVDGFTAAGSLERPGTGTSCPPPAASPYLTAREAAAYLRISYSTFRKIATKVVRVPGTRRYRREDLDRYAQTSRNRRHR